MTRFIREKTNCILVKWCCLDNRRRQMWATTQLWQQIFSNSSPTFCICHCPAIACDFPLILRNWSVLFSCLTLTLVLQCHFYWRLLCSNHLLSPLPLLFSPSLFLSWWQIPPCPANVVSTAAAHSLDLEPSVRGLSLQQRIGCLCWCGRNHSQMLVSVGEHRATNIICITGKLFSSASHRMSRQMLKRGEKHQAKAIMKAASADPCGQSEFEYSIFSLHAFCLNLLSQFTPFWLQ